MVPVIIGRFGCLSGDRSTPQSLPESDTNSDRFERLKDNLV